MTVLPIKFQICMRAEAVIGLCGKNGRACCPMPQEMLIVSEAAASYPEP
jgi:hypothetical protein